MNQLHIPCAEAGLYRWKGSGLQVISSWWVSKSLVSHK
jgi:hypothetical protein